MTGAVRSRAVSPGMSLRRPAKATHSSPGRWQRNNSRRRHSSPMPISSFPSAPPTPGWLCQPLCPGCQGQRPALCNTRSRTPSGKRIHHGWGRTAWAHFCCKGGGGRRQPRRTRRVHSLEVGFQSPVHGCGTSGGGRLHPPLVSLDTHTHTHTMLLSPRL